MVRQAKKQFFGNLKTQDVTDNKTFWKTVKPFLTDKVQTKSKITLIEKKLKDNSTEFSEEIITEDKKIADVFNNFFFNIVSDLEIPIIQNYDMCFEKTEDLVLNAMKKYRDQPDRKSVV